MILNSSSFYQALQACSSSSGLDAGSEKPFPAVRVALSGGLDSTVLLHLCSQLRNQGLIVNLRAVHVHHGLSCYADQWADFAQSLCQSWQVPLAVVRVSCGAGDNLEARAREARYKVFTEQLQAGEVMLQAHHQDDQVETLLYRMMRGTGIAGLKGMPVSRPLGQGILLRPLLDFSRAAIETYGQEQQLQWVEDDSNSDTRFDRNYLRAEIIPALHQRWPGMKMNVARLSVLSVEADEVLTEVAQADLAQALRPQNLPGVGLAELLSIESLLSLSSARQHLLLREWLSLQSVPVPARAALEQIVEEVINARVDAEPCVEWSGYTLYRHRGCLYIGNRLSEFSSVTVPFTGEALSLPENGVIAVTVSGNQPRVMSLRSQLQCSCTPRDHVQVQPFALAGRKGRKSLKKWLNELGVPGWLRGRLPVLHRGEELVAIPGVCVAEGWQADGDDPGLVLDWRLLALTSV